MKRSIRTYAVSSLFLGMASVFCVYAWISFSVKDFHTKDVSALEHRPVALLLGTSKSLENGQPNPFYTERIKALSELYNAYKIDCVLISGDNTSMEYNEPLMIQNSLLELGIPAERMYLDYAWIRTLDSLLRARDIFWLSKFTVVSQAFHTERAIYLAKKSGLDVIGFDAGGVPFLTGLPVYIREAFSRVLAAWDVAVGTEPKYTGEPVAIEYNPTVRPVPKKICTPRTQE